MLALAVETDSGRHRHFEMLSASTKTTKWVDVSSSAQRVRQASRPLFLGILRV